LPRLALAWQQEGRGQREEKQDVEFFNRGFSGILLIPDETIPDVLAIALIR